jgi:hypothetical protein
MVARLDGLHTPLAIGAVLLPLVALLMLPTGVLNGNEEYYFQVSQRMLFPERFGEYSAILTASHHLWLSSLTIGVPTAALGFEAADALLRVVCAAALAGGCAWLFSAWKLSALDALLVVGAFSLLGQDLFGGEWLMLSVEGKVFAYVFVLFALGECFRRRLASCVVLLVVATYFHVQVGGFWALAVLAWRWLERRDVDFAGTVKAGALYALAVLPMFALIAWQRSQRLAEVDAVEAARANLERIAPHVAPFSSKFIFWNWSAGIVLAGGLLCAAYFLFEAARNRRTANLLLLVMGLLGFLFLALAASTTERAVALLGSLMLFRPASLTLLLALTAAAVLLKEGLDERRLLRAASLVVLPVAFWAAAQFKIEQVLEEDVGNDDIVRLAKVIDDLNPERGIVLTQPGYDVQRPDRVLPRVLESPTLVNWKFAPSVPYLSQIWSDRERFRRALFAIGCARPLEYPVSVLVARADRVPDVVLESCGPIVWEKSGLAVIKVLAGE